MPFAKVRGGSQVQTTSAQSKPVDEPKEQQKEETTDDRQDK